MASTSTALTVGGFAVSLAATGIYLWKWWKTPTRRPADLAPFAGSYVLGGLSTMCAGILGILAGWTALLGNGVGRHAVSSAAGGHADVMSHSTAGVLGQGGRLVAFLFAVGFIVAFKAASKQVKQKLWWGWFCGATLTLTVGVAGLFLHVTGVANGIGDGILNWANGVSA
jgi:hypothetical protein